MKQIIILIALLCSTTLVAQTTFEDVLRSVEMNNNALKAGYSEMEAQKLDAKAANNLKNPTVSYSHLYGNRPGAGFQGEFVASQSFDFPSAYVQRHKRAKERGVSLDYQYRDMRRQILLQAKEVCLDLIYLKQQRQLLEKRYQNAKQLADAYTMRFKAGDADILETNKIELELLNVDTEVRQNGMDAQKKMNELVVLNGGVPIVLADTVFVSDVSLLPLAELLEEVMAANPDVMAKRSEQLVSNLNLKAVRSEGLPEIEVGYRMNPASGGERFNGFMVGLSIPIFANKNKVKSAKAMTRMADFQYENTLVSLRHELMGLYSDAVSLQESVQLYSTLLEKQHTIALLTQALNAGQISVTEYFVNTAAYFQSMENYLQVQNEYHKLIAKIYDYRL